MWTESQSGDKKLLFYPAKCVFSPLTWANQPLARTLDYWRNLRTNVGLEKVKTLWVFVVIQTKKIPLQVCPQAENLPGLFTEFGTLKRIRSNGCFRIFSLTITHCPHPFSLALLLFQSGEWGVFPPRFGLISTMAGDLYSPPSPLGDSLLDSPLCGDLIEDLCDISQSIGDNTLGFDFPEYQSPCSGSESSIALGE